MSDKTKSASFSSSDENSESGNIEIPWGTITSKLDSSTGQITFDLHDECFSIGSDINCEWNLKCEIVPFISKIQCRITKDLSDSTNPVVIEDLSERGTFCNRELIGLNNKIIMAPGDIIAFNEEKYEVFIFASNYKKLDWVPDEIFTKYHIGRFLGRGGFGQVHLVLDRKTIDKFAMKSVRKTAGKLGFIEDAQIDLEVKITMDLYHANVVRCHSVFKIENCVYMMLDFMDGGTLLQRIQIRKCLSEENSKYYFRQLCAALNYIHSRNIVHCDINPENILLLNHDNQTLLKLSDFGLSKLFKENCLTLATCGSVLYASPEMIERKIFTPKVDIWSLGVTLYVMLNGVLPFKGGTSIRSGLYNFINELVQDSAKNIIANMLQVDPIKRISIEQILLSEWLNEDKN